MAEPEWAVRARTADDNDVKLARRIAEVVRDAILAEREACAKIAEAPAWSAPTANGEWALREVAKIVATEIRARGTAK